MFKNMAEIPYTIEMEDADDVVATPDEEVRFIWSKPAVEDLILLYKKHLSLFEDPQVKKRSVWKKVCQQMLEKGHSNLNDEMCYNKWRNLRKVYKEHIAGDRSEQSRQRWGFFDSLKELFADDPAFQNLQDVHRKKRPNDAMEVVEVPIDDDDVLPVSAKKVFREHVSLGQEPVSSLHQSSIHRASVSLVTETPAWFKEFLQTYRQDEARRMEALRSMHSDIMKLERKKCALLQELISKLNPDDDETNPQPELRHGMGNLVAGSGIKLNNIDEQEITLVTENENESEEEPAESSEMYSVSKQKLPVTSICPSTPRVSTAMISSPLVSKPLVSKPVVLTPVISKPVVSTPVVSTPVVSTPVVSTPVVSTPVVSTPVVSTPVVSTPVVSTPVVSTPVVSTPLVSKPLASGPLVSGPQVSTPSVSGPQVSTPPVSKPRFNLVQTLQKVSIPPQGPVRFVMTSKAVVRHPMVLTTSQAHGKVIPVRKLIVPSGTNLTKNPSSLKIIPLKTSTPVDTSTGR